MLDPEAARERPRGRGVGDDRADVARGEVTTDRLAPRVGDVRVRGTK
jgi:hypothetical protein